MDAGDLYGLPLDRFVPERGALARALRGDGRREEAASIAGLRKPSVAAWAVNQLVRTQHAGVTELFDAGDALRGAQSDVLAGQSDRGGLRAAAERERASVDALVTAARGLLTGEGHELSETIIDRVADTIHAAALDDEARAKVREGRLERELRHVGLGIDAGAAPPLVTADRRTPARDTPAQDRGRRSDVGRAERERTHARNAARAAEADARRLADRAVKAVQVAQERRERAAQALRDAEDSLVTARADAEAAAGVHRRAQQGLKNV
jgi:hypothetical protein